MRTYGQYCALAKALDVVGDRWSLLIVRELLLRGPSRYTDLRHGLPGIATNLLAERLRQLEQDEIVRRFAAPPPVATTLFELTPRGAELEPVLQALGRWGAPLLADAGDDDAFRSHWLAFPLERHLRDASPDEPPVSIELRTGDQPVTIETRGGGVHVRPGPAEEPDGVLAGPHRPLIATLFRDMTLRNAESLGVRYAGDRRALQRLEPR